MLFEFVNLKSDTISNHDKGHYFEKFVKLMLESSGYHKLELNRKRNSLEFDIIGEQILDSNQKIIGEAKALARKISSEKFGYFVSKMILEWDKNNKTVGLFVSITELTAEAEDYFEKINTTDRPLKIITGEDVLNQICKNRNYISFKQIQKKIRNESNFQISDIIFLITNIGYFYVQLLILENEAIPKYFQIYNFENGKIIDDKQITHKIQESIDILKPLTHFSSSKKEKISKAYEEYFPYIPTVEGGADWFDYRLPASPEYFIGRKDKLNQFSNSIDDYLKGKTNVTIIEILSKSGVGKSSFLLKARSLIEEKKWFCPIIDARDISNALGILRITNYFVKDMNNLSEVKLNFPKSIKECYETMYNIDSILASCDKYGIIFLDQFEGLYSQSMSFDYIFEFFYEISKTCKRILLCIGRKSDYLTTFDESIEIDFKRLHQNSMKINLPDFIKEEAEILIDRVEEELGEKIKKQLREIILELSNGFPWLHKRICYHIIKLHEGKKTQEEIIETGLQLEDLFNEELENLDEIDKEFLKSLVMYLPASIYSLQDKFGNSSLFRKRIQKLSDLRLIRLSGHTYDTYNDFFKEFIKTGKIPLRKRYIHRVYPKAILKWLEILYFKQYTTVSEVVENENISKNALYNNIREMRILGLLDTEREYLRRKVSVDIISNREELKQYIRSQLIENKVISEVINRLNEVEANENVLPLVIEVLKESFNFVEATDKTWTTYARILIAWIVFAMSDSIEIDQSNYRTVIRRDRNLFFPTIFPQKAITILLRIRDTKQPKTENILKKKGEDRAIGTLRRLGLVQESVGIYKLTEKGLDLLTKNQEEMKSSFGEILKGYRNVKEFLIMLKFNQNLDANTLFLLLLQNYNYDEKWTETSTRWHYKTFKSWLEYSNLVIKLKKATRKIYHPDNLRKLEDFL